MLELSERAVRRRRPVVLGALLVAVASQVSISLVAVGFNISVAVILLPVFSFLSPSFPVLPAALLAAPGVFALRCAIHWLTLGTLSGCWGAFAPELVFYLVYGALLALCLRRLPLAPFHAGKCLPLALIDALANLAELLVRLGADALRPVILLQVLAVGAVRAALVWAAIRALDYYGIRVLRREDAERYQRLLLMTASLKGEVAWMEKGTELIEATMNNAYQLYSQLRRAGDATAAGTALTIAKDVHEIKKEYFLIMRGISEALDGETARAGMSLSELFDILEQSTRRLAQSLDRSVKMTAVWEHNFYTTRHFYLMSILRNLLNNAVEAAGSGRLCHITLRQQSHEGQILFQVQDDCGGIPPDRVGQIFTPGFSSKINYTTGAVSRGLGLSIVKDLTEEQLGGQVTVEVLPAAQGHTGGTIFTVSVPRERLEEDSHAVLPG